MKNTLKALLGLQLIFMFAIISLVTAQTCVMPPSGLVSWWSGDGNAKDMVGKNHGTPVGTGPFFGPGLVDQAFRLNGVDAHINIPASHSLNFGTNNFTILLWVSFSGAIEPEQVLIENLIETFQGTRQGSGITKWPGYNLAFGGPRYTDPQQDEPYVSAMDLPFVQDQWNLVVITRSGDTYTLYWNGLNVGSDSTVGHYDLSSTASWKIGHRGNPDDTPGSLDGRGFYLNGLVDEIQIFNRALSDEEIAAIYNAGVAGVCKDNIKNRLRVIASFSKKGAGVVTSNDGLIFCGDGGVCEHKYYGGSPVVLEANPDVGSFFVGWTPTSLGCGAEPTCAVNMDGNRTVKAKFRGPNKLKVQVKSKRGGSGTVLSNIPGLDGETINCPTTLCENYYTLTDAVTLTATPQGGSAFLGWKPASLGCSVNFTCDVPMDRTRNIRAVFGPQVP